MQIVRTALVLFLGLLVADVADVRAQRRRPTRAAQPGTVSNVKWSGDGKSVFFTSETKRYKFDLEAKKKSESNGSESGKEGEDEGGPAQRIRFGRGLGAGNTGKQLGRPARGRQHIAVESPAVSYTHLTLPTNREV